jgi:hypothetical protein
LSYYRSQLLFNDEDLSVYLSNLKVQIAEEIRNEEEDYILNVGQESYINHLIEKYMVDYLELYSDSAYAETKEELIAAEDFPSFLFNVYAGKKYPKEVYYFYVPFNGNSSFLKYRPSTFSLSPPRATVKNNLIVLRLVKFYDGVEEINREYQSFINSLTQMVEYLNKDLREFNEGLENFIITSFNARKNELLKRREQQSALIVPIKRKTDVPNTFAVPSPKVKKKISIKPVQTTKDYLPEPTLNEEVYMDILKIINDMGKEFERKPSVYSNKSEEDLRDHFLMMLEPNFEGSATGETFNKSGKTDILLRYHGSNVFVGECKFWTGQKGFLKTIDQLLGYLTWRDSKTAVIMFVNNKDFTSVVKTAKEVIQQHPNFVKHNNDYDESWSNYTFHINGDKNKEIKLALMLYHTP